MVELGKLVHADRAENPASSWEDISLFVHSCCRVSHHGREGHKGATRVTVTCRQMTRVRKREIKALKGGALGILLWSGNCTASMDTADGL